MASMIAIDTVSAAAAIATTAATARLERTSGIEVKRVPAHERKPDR